MAESSAPRTHQRDEQRVEQHVDLDAPVDDVWRSLTDPDELAEWLGSDVDLDVEVAGTGRVTDPDGTVRQVLVTHVVPHERLAWHWWADDGELSSVEFTLEPLVDATRLRVVETLAARPSSGGAVRAQLFATRVRASFARAGAHSTVFAVR